MKIISTLIIAGLSVCLTGRVVYMPMQCAAPQITDKNQGEFTISTYLNGRTDVAATYWPVRRLLVRAAHGNLRNNSRDNTYYSGHQAGWGMLGYNDTNPT